MPNTGKHQEVKSKQNIDGTFEFIVEDSDAVDEAGAEIEAPVETGSEPSGSSRLPVVVGLAAALILATIAVFYAMGSDDARLSGTEEEPAGFRPYKASGSNVEVPADAPSNEVPIEEAPDEPAEVEPAEVVEAETEADVEILEEDEEEFVEADEVIGDGEILDGSEEEMLEAAQAAQQDSDGRKALVKPAIRSDDLDMTKISESIRSQISNGVNPAQIEGIRNLSPAQLQQLQQNVQKERLRQRREENSDPAQ